MPYLVVGRDVVVVVCWIVDVDLGITLVSLAKDIGWTPLPCLVIVDLVTLLPALDW